MHLLRRSIRLSCSPEQQLGTQFHTRAALRIGLALFWLALAVTPTAEAAEPSARHATPVVTPTPVTLPGTPASSHASGGLFGVLPDPKKWAADVFSQVIVTFLQGISSALHSVVQGVMGSSLNFITQTPPSGSYASPTVKTLWGVVRTIADAALMLVALFAGFNVMARQQLGTPYHGVMEVLPRLVLGALLVNTSLSWGQLAIDINNALCGAIGQTSLPAWQHADTLNQALMTVIASLVYLVTSLLLLLQMLMRLALIDVLLVAAPLGLLCWVLPQTNGWARLWSTTFFGAVFTQFVQVIALKLGGSLATDLTPVAPDAALLSVFLGVAVLVVTLKIPTLMRHHAGDGLGFVRYLAYQQTARAITGRGGSSRAGGGD